MLIFQLIRICWIKCQITLIGKMESSQINDIRKQEPIQYFMVKISLANNRKRYLKNINHQIMRTSLYRSGVDGIFFGGGTPRPLKGFHAPPAGGPGTNRQRPLASWLCDPEPPTTIENSGYSIVCEQTRKILVKFLEIS